MGGGGGGGRRPEDLPSGKLMSRVRGEGGGGGGRRPADLLLGKPERRCFSRTVDVV